MQREFRAAYFRLYGSTDVVVFNGNTTLTDGASVGGDVIGGRYRLRERLGHRLHHQDLRFDPEER